MIDMECNSVVPLPYDRPTRQSFAPASPVPRCRAGRGLKRFSFAHVITDNYILFHTIVVTFMVNM